MKEAMITKYMTAVTNALRQLADAAEDVTLKAGVSEGDDPQIWVEAKGVFSTSSAVPFYDELPH